MRHSKKPYVIIFLIALSASLVFSQIIHPGITHTLNAGIDPDRYGELGYGLYHHGVLSYYPASDPVVTRGPFYPWLISSLLRLSGDWYPRAIQIFQAFIFGCTCCLVYAIANRLFSPAVAFVSSLICALHPNLIWFTARIWVETVTTFLFLGLILFLLRYVLRPHLISALLIGLCVGIGSLTKQVFLPFVLFAPMVILFYCKRLSFLKHIPVMVLTALVVVLPWSVRNYRLTGKIVPVHTSAGMNFRMGDYMIRHLHESAFSFGGRFAEALESIEPALAIRGTESVAAQTVDADSRLASESKSFYRENPFFLFKKMAVNSAYIWFLGETPKKSLLIAILNIPFIILGALYVFIHFRNIIATPAGIPGIMSAFFVFMYLPIYAIARFSTPVLPVVIMYACALIPDIPIRKRTDSAR